MNAWFEALGRRFAETARKKGVEIAEPELDPGVADEVLELARVAAHSKERRFAPLACFMAGVAVERLRQAGVRSPSAGAGHPPTRHPGPRAGRKPAREPQRSPLA